MENENLPFVSIIIPTKNEEKRIESCLNALFSIDYPNEKFEVLVIDNGSVDSTVRIAQKNKATVYIRPELTIAGLRNFGSQNASGTLIAFVDADVIVDRCWLRNAVKNFTSNNKSIACAGANPGIPNNATWVMRGRYLMVLVKELKNIERKWITSMNLIVRKDIFMEVGGFNVGLITCEDVDLGYRISKRYRIVYDKSIKAVHLGEPRTLAELFRKEMWRGTSNYQGIRSHGIISHEIPSLLMPIFYLGGILTAGLAMIFGAFTSAFWIVAALLLLPVFKTLTVVIVTGQYMMGLAFFICYTTYLLARTFSVLNYCRIKLQPSSDKTS